MRAFWRATGPCLMGCVPGGAGALARADAYPVSTCWPSSSGSRAASVARNCSNAPHSQRVRRVSLASVRQHPAQVRPVARHLGPEGRLAAPARAGAGPRLSPAVRRRCRPGGGRTRRDGPARRASGRESARPWPQLTGHPTASDHAGISATGSARNAGSGRRAQVSVTAEPAGQVSAVFCSFRARRGRPGHLVNGPLCKFL